MIDCLPFGKWQGTPLADVPTSYLSWVASLEDLSPALAEAVSDELLSRGRGDSPDTTLENERLRKRIRELEDDLAAVLEHHGECYQPRRRARP